jgi:hypothetical protein
MPVVNPTAFQWSIQMSDNQPTDTIHTPVESADACEGSAPAPASPERQRLSELAAQLANATERKRALRAKVDTMSRARQAAQGDAQAARQQWSTKLRDSDGTLTRDIQKLRANERSALSLAEEYEAMEVEISAELPRLELELAKIADQCRQGKWAIFREVAQQANEQLLAELGNRLAVTFELFSLAENAGKDPRQALDNEVLSGLFFSRLQAGVQRSRPHVADQVAKLLALPGMDMSEVDMQLVGSLAARSKLQAQINAGKPQG